MRKPANFGFLEKCTKEELIAMIKGNCCFNQLFTYSDVLSYRWNKKSKELMEKESAHTDLLKSFDATRQDELVTKFNAETDFQEKLKIAKQMEPYERKIKAWFDTEEELHKEQIKIDKLYRQLMASYKE